MDPKNRFFVYERREMFILLLLGMIVALFAFTLGVHLGKKDLKTGSHGSHGAPAGVEAPHDAGLVKNAPDQAPSRQELTEASRTNDQVSEDLLDQNLREEVLKTGIAIKVPKQTELPKDKKKPAPVNRVHEKARSTQEKTAHKLAPPVKKTHNYALQIGSFPTHDEASKQLKSFESHGMEVELKPVQIKGKGTWFRLYAGGFESKEEARKRGETLVQDGKIRSFVITYEKP